MSASIFLDINLPNPTTWFYASGLLAVALFLKFNRLFSVRNLDVLSLFLPMPGLLLLIEGSQAAAPEDAQGFYFWGYLWLLAATLYFLVRCLLDLVLVQRPALGANLEFAGLAWLAGALYLGLVAVAVRDPGGAADNAARAPTDTVRNFSEKVVYPVAPAVDEPSLRLWVERGLALLCHLSVVVGLVLIGWRHFGDVAAGMSAATFYLLLPYTYLLLPGAQANLGRWDHAWPMAFLVWAVFCYRSPRLSGAFVGVACGSAFFPLVIVPTWLSFYRGRGEGRFGSTFLLSAALCLLGLLVIGWLNGELPTSLRTAWTESDWQPWKRPHAETRGFWQDIPSARVARAPWAYRLPVFVASAALVALTLFWPSPKDLAQVLALSAACLASVQLWYAERGGTYLFWYLPFVLLLVFRPNLSTAQPPPAPPGTRPWKWGWLARMVRRVVEHVKPSSSSRPGKLESGLSSHPRAWRPNRMRTLTNFLGALVILTLIAAPAVFAHRRNLETRNFAIVHTGVLYRSGQLSPAGLVRIVHDHGIRTVINLRDGNDKTDQAEEEYCAREDIRFFRLRPLAWSDGRGGVPAEENVQRFRAILADPANHPVLVHCFAGTHRTGAYCEVYRMEFEGWGHARALAEVRSFGYVNLDHEADILAYLEGYRPQRQP